MSQKWKIMRVSNGFKELASEIKAIEQERLQGLKVNDIYVTQKIADNVRKLLPRRKL